MKHRCWFSKFKKRIFFLAVIGTALIGYTSDSIACGGGGSGGGGGGGGAAGDARKSANSSAPSVSVVASPPPAVALTIAIVPLENQDRNCSFNDISCDPWLEQRFYTVMLDLLNSYYSMSVGNQSNPEQVELMSNLAARVVAIK